MSHFADAKAVGVRNKENEKLVAVYPEQPVGTNEEVTKAVTDWYYKQGCFAEDELKSLYVDILTDNEINERKS